MPESARAVLADPASIRGYLSLREIAFTALAYGLTNLGLSSLDVTGLLGPLGVLLSPANVAAAVALFEAVRRLRHGKPAA